MNTDCPKLTTWGTISYRHQFCVCRLKIVRHVCCWCLRNSCDHWSPSALQSRRHCPPEHTTCHLGRLHRLSCCQTCHCTMEMMTYRSCHYTTKVTTYSLTSTPLGDIWKPFNAFQHTSASTILGQLRTSVYTYHLQFNCAITFHISTGYCWKFCSFLLYCSIKATAYDEAHIIN